MPKIDRATLTKIAPDPQSVKALEDLFKESSDSTGAIAVVTKIANNAQSTANAASLAANSALSAANAANMLATDAKNTADGAVSQIDTIKSPAGAHTVGFAAANNASGTNVQDAIMSLDANDGSGFRNVVLNGSFIVNQRKYVSGTPTTAANQYTLDLWRVVVSGQGITFAPTNNGNLVTVPAGGMEQVIEGALIVGSTYIINWLGTTSGFVNGSPVTPGTVLSLTAGANCTIKFAGGTVGSVQLEQGRSAHPFEPRPYSVEIRLCQRYAFVWTSLGTVGVCATDAGSYAILFPTRMRIPASYTGLTNATFSDGVSTINITGTTLTQIDEVGATVSFTAPTAVAGRGAILKLGSTAIFSAEL